MLHLAHAEASEDWHARCGVRSAALALVICSTSRSPTSCTLLTPLDPSHRTAELRQRSVRIFKPSKTSNSSGKAGTGHWRVDFDVLQGSARWENPLMGWAST